MPKINLSYGIWILICVFFIYFVNLDVLYINLMETRNMLTAREMVDHNHWILTTMNDLPRYEKPPLPTWITAIFGVLFGFKSFMVMRLPAAFTSLMLIWFFYKFVPLLKVSQKQAFLASLILATSFYLIFSGRTNQWDIYTNGFMMLCIYYLFRFLQHSKNAQRNLILSAIFFGFSIMSKGPVALYALFLPFLISYGLTYRFKNFKTKWSSLFWFLIIGLGIGTWWFIYVRIADPQSFVDAIKEESSRWGSYNVRPFYYYWSFFVQSGIWTIPAFVSLLFPYLKTRVSDRKAYTFSLIWTLASVILLSLIPEKKARYLLPTLIPLALNISFYIEYLFRRFKRLSLKESFIVYFHQSIIALIGLIFPIAGYIYLQPKGIMWIWFVLTSISLLIVGLGSIYFMKKKNFPKMFYLNIFVICAVMSFGYRFTDELNENPLSNNIVNLKERAHQEGFQVYELGVFEPRMIWEYGEPIPKIDVENPIFPEENRFGLLIRDEDMEIVDSLEHHYKIIREERFDNNYVAPKKRAYRDRLIRNFFLLERN